MVSSRDNTLDATINQSQRRDIDIELEKQSKLKPSIYVNVKKPADYESALDENVITSDLNTHIILGGATQNTPEIAKGTYNSTITLISGMGTAIKNKPPPLTASKMSFSPKFYYDSALIQISEQTNVDSNFGAKIKDPKSENVSAIALKADEVRLFSRGTVKIITGIDQYDTPLPANKDVPPPSHPKRDYSGIHLIANNSVERETELHPLVLGRNLQEFLNEVLNEITNLHSLIHLITEHQSRIYNSLMGHTHFDIFSQGPLPRYTDPELIADVVQSDEEIKKLTIIDAHTKKVPNIENLRKNYLTKNPSKYINSYYNKTN
jgi:hypothetical protein